MSDLRRFGEVDTGPFRFGAQPETPTGESRRDYRAEVLAKLEAGAARLRELGESPRGVSPEQIEEVKAALEQWRTSRSTNT